MSGARRKATAGLTVLTEDTPASGCERRWVPIGSVVLAPSAVDAPHGRKARTMGIVNTSVGKVSRATAGSTVHA